MAIAIRLREAPVTLCVRFLTPVPYDSVIDRQSRHSTEAKLMTV